MKKTSRKPSAFDMARECVHVKDPSIWEPQFLTELAGSDKIPSMTAYKKVLTPDAPAEAMPIVFCPKCRSWAHLENGVAVIGGERADMNPPPKVKP